MVPSEAGLWPLRARIGLYPWLKMPAIGGSRARLQAAIVRVNWTPTRLTPRSIVCAIGPTVLAHPAQCGGPVARTATRPASADASAFRQSDYNGSHGATESLRVAVGPAAGCARLPGGHGPDRVSLHGQGRESTRPSRHQPDANPPD